MKRYAFVGASSRGLYMYGIPLTKDYPDCGSIVGIYDPNRKRAEFFQKKTNAEFPVFNSFDDMIKESQPDVVIITTIDRYHHEYAIKAMNAGCDVIIEKPMTIDDEKCNAILEAEKRTGKNVIVTFNLRYAPFSIRIKELLKEGTIGDILNVHFEWNLDTSHGADYFRRWHRRKENSGGLLIHKCTHHFDLINWFLEEDPVAVSAFGTTRFYGPTRDNSNKRCLTCKIKGSCEFYFDIESQENGSLKDLYLKTEDVDGYIRDACVFSDEIAIEDTINLVAKYSGGASMSYSLAAHSPYEGYSLAFNGTLGRLEAKFLHGAIGPFAGQEIYELKVYNRKQEEITYKIPKPSGVHGGADTVIQRAVFRNDLPDVLGQQAGTRAGAMSIAVGIAANKSIKEGKTIYIKDLLFKV